MTKLNATDIQLKEEAERSLLAFIELVHPDRVLGHVHKELINWWTRSEAKNHQLVLLPRDHQKSAMVAYRVAWEITRNPAIRVLYISATTNLAEKQLYFVKNILTSSRYQKYWPEMVNQQESTREKWTTGEIAVDHQKRKDENVRDPTVFTAGLNTTVTGLHCDVCVLDDVVIDDNSETKLDRDKTALRVSYLASVGGTEGSVWAVGTRYHPEDLYNTFLETTWESFDDEGNVIGTDYLYEVFERQVEDRGDGTGQFIWPRMQRYDGKWFGFNKEILAKKKAQYFDKSKFNAQYYNNPNAKEDAPIDPAMFQYFDRNLLSQHNGYWFYKGRRLNLAAAIDFAYTVRKGADYTTIVVAGIDAEHNIFVLDIERFQTKDIVVYYNKLLKLYTKWGFRKLRAEVTMAQTAIVQELKTSYLRPNGILLTIEEHRPTNRHGTKEERIEAALYPRYQNQKIYHFKGGMCELLEDELTSAKPKHDDIKDALASCTESLIPPSGGLTISSIANSYGPKKKTYTYDTISFNQRFGGLG